MIKRFARYYKPHLRLFLIDIFCAFVVAVCNLVYPKIAGEIVDVHVPKKNIDMILIFGGILLAIYVLKCFLNLIFSWSALWTFWF